MERVEEKLDKVLDKIVKIDVTLAEQHVVLKDHIRRTEMLEKQVAPMHSTIERLKGGMGLAASAGTLILIFKFMQHYL